MVNKINNCPSFGSTRIPYNNVPVHKYLEPLNKYFEVKEFNLMKPQEAADKLDFGKAAAMFDKDGMIIRILGITPTNVPVEYLFTSIKYNPLAFIFILL